MTFRRYFWFILATCILSAAATMFQLLTVYLMGLVEVPRVYDHLNALISKETDLANLKAACLRLTQLDELERDGRIKLMIYSPLIALVTSVMCAALATWALVATRKPAQVSKPMQFD